MNQLLNFVWWLALVFTIYFGIGHALAIYFIKSNMEVSIKPWATVLFITSIVALFTLG